MSRYVRVELAGDRAIVVDEEVHPGEVALRVVFDECVDEQPCYCPICQRRVISEEKRCPDCGLLLWGTVVMPEGWKPPWEQSHGTEETGE